jgi:predicted RNase H-like HicB family nuclease
VRYIAILETDGTSWNAYVPDLPGCVAAGDTREEVSALIREAVPLHVESLRGRGEHVPEPSAIAALGIDAA